MSGQGLRLALWSVATGIFFILGLQSKHLLVCSKLLFGFGLDTTPQTQHAGFEFSFLKAEITGFWATMLCSLLKFLRLVYFVKDRGSPSCTGTTSNSHLGGSRTSCSREWSEVGAMGDGQWLVWWRRNVHYLEYSKAKLWTILWT